MAIFNVTDEAGLIAAFNNANSGDTINVAAGEYTNGVAGNFIMSVLYDFGNPVTVNCAAGVIFHGNGKPRTLDLKGANVTWNGGEFRGGASNFQVDIRGDHIIFNGADVHGDSGGPLLANKGIGLIGKHNTISNCTIHDFGNIGIDGNGGYYNENKVIQQGEHRSSQDWYIYGNEIYNIHYNNFGFHEGAMKLVPWCRDIYIYANHVHDCDGQGIWLDRPEGQVVIYGNLVERVGGKSIFYEISDDTPGNLTYGCEIAKNKVYEGQKHGIFISSSSNTNVYANIVESWLPIVCHGMPREIDKIGGIPGTGTDWRLDNNYMHHNVLKNTTHRSHIAVYDYDDNVDPNATNNTFDTNYYSTGHDVIFNNNVYNITEATFALGISEGLNHITQTGLAGNDPTGLEGPFITTLPGAWTDAVTGVATLLVTFPFLYESGATPTVPVIDPPPDPNVEDPVVSIPNGDFDIYIFSDYSPYTDKDDLVSMSAALLTMGDRLKGIIVGCTPQTATTGTVYAYPGPLELYQGTHGAAVVLEGANVNLGPFDVWEAGSHGTRYNVALPSRNTIDDIIANIETSTNHIFLLNWGILTELAHLYKIILAEKPHLVDRMTIISHATDPTTLNNYSKDQFAGFYLKNLASAGTIRFIELGFAGKDTIDDRNAATGEMDPAVMDSAIGEWFKEKWIEASLSQPGRPDFSDYASYCVFIPELGYGYDGDFWMNVKYDGTSNLDLFCNNFNNKAKLYEIIEDAAVQAQGYNPLPPPPVDPDCPDVDLIQAKIDAIRLLLDDIETEISTP